MTGKRAGSDGRGEELSHQRIVSSIKSSTLIRCKLKYQDNKNRENQLRRDDPDRLHPKT